MFVVVCFVFQLFFHDTFFCEGILFILCHHSLVGLLDAQTFVVGDLTLGWEKHTLFQLSEVFLSWGICEENYSVFWVKKKKILFVHLEPSAFYGIV